MNHTAPAQPTNGITPAPAKYHSYYIYPRTEGNPVNTPNLAHHNNGTAPNTSSTGGGGADSKKKLTSQALPQSWELALDMMKRKRSVTSPTTNLGGRSATPSEVVRAQLTGGSEDKVGIIQFIGCLKSQFVSPENSINSSPKNYPQLGLICTFLPMFIALPKSTAIPKIDLTKN